MKGKRIFCVLTVITFFFSIGMCSFSEFTNPNHSYPNPSKDDERIIHLTTSIPHQIGEVEVFLEAYVNETRMDQGYFYQTWYSISFEELAPNDWNETSIVFGWIVESSIYSYISHVGIPEGKQVFFNFSSYEPIASCFLCTRGSRLSWISEDHKPPINSLYSCAIVVDDVFSFEFSHFIFTDYAIYEIINDVSFSPITNHTMGPGSTTAYGNVLWSMNRVARFTVDSDIIINTFNATPNYCFSAGFGQEWATSEIVLADLTEFSGSGNIESTPGGATVTNNNFPHQVYYRMDIDRINETISACIDVGFVNSEYFQSEWALLPGWAKFTIIGGGISLLGCAGFVAQLVFTLLKKRRPRSK